MKTKLICILFFLALSSGVRATIFETGNSIYSGLEDFKKDNSSNVVKASSSFGYIIGVHDTLQDVVVCSPSTITKGQLLDIVFNHLRDNPQTRHLPADILVRQALLKFYPCKKK